MFQKRKQQQQERVLQQQRAEKPVKQVTERLERQKMQQRQLQLQQQLLQKRPQQDFTPISAQLVTVGVLATLANSKAESIEARLSKDFDSRLTRFVEDDVPGKIPKDLVNITDKAQVHMLCSSATELLHKQKLEGSWNTDNTTLSVTTFFYEGKTKCAPSSALDVRSGIDFDLRTNFVRTTSGDLKPALVLCLTKGKVILEQRDVSDLVLHGREIVDGASVEVQTIGGTQEIGAEEGGAVNTWHLFNTPRSS